MERYIGRIFWNFFLSQTPLFTFGRPCRTWSSSFSNDISSLPSSSYNGQSLAPTLNDGIFLLRLLCERSRALIPSSTTVNKLTTTTTPSITSFHVVKVICSYLFLFYLRIWRFMYALSDLFINLPNSLFLYLSSTLSSLWQVLFIIIIKMIRFCCYYDLLLLIYSYNSWVWYFFFFSLR